MDLNLEKFAEESKGLFEAMSAKLKGHQTDIDSVRKGMETFLAEQKSLKDSVDGLATKINRPAQPESKDEKSKAYEQAFDNYIRKGIETPELKSVATDSDPAGGYLLPQNRVQAILEKAVQYAPIRGLANVVTISSGDTLELPVEGATAFAQAIKGEHDARTETTSGTFTLVRIPTYEYAAMPYVSQKMVDDAFLDIEAYINKKVQEQIMVAFSEDAVNGTGAGEPTGFTTETIDSVLSGTAGLASIAGLAKLFFKVKPQYRQNGSWAMNGNTLAAIYGLASTTGAPLLQPDLRTGFGFVIHGRPVFEFPELPDEGAAAYPIYFGDWNSAVTIVDRVGVRVIRDIYSAKPHIQLYTTMRMGVKTVLPSALAKMKSNNA